MPPLSWRCQVLFVLSCSIYWFLLPAACTFISHGNLIVEPPVPFLAGSNLTLHCDVDNCGQEDKESGFDLKNLSISGLDLFFAGTETTTTTLNWALLYMISYPEIQAKVQAEIDAVVGSCRTPSMQDRDELHFTNAVIHEVQRLGNIIPLNVGHMTTKDTTLENYIIPKGVTVVGCLGSVLHEETIWETPHTFNPRHFLDEHGKFRKRDAFILFSIGKRVCLGEQLARMELFLFFSALLQQFTFSAPNGERPSLDYDMGFVRTPKPYHLCAKLR